jgi:hypothetical protein
MIDKWKRLAKQEPDRQLRADYAGLALVFVELTRHASSWRQALKGWNMRESQVILEWQREARAEAVLTTQRSNLLRALQLRFKKLPPDLKAAVVELTDLEELSRWFDAAVTAPSLDAFREAVQR